MKYISKPKSSLHLKLTIAAAVRKSIIDEGHSSSDPAKSILLKTYNKITSHRAVGLPEAISHLLKYKDHYMDKMCRSIHTTYLYYYLNGYMYCADDENVVEREVSTEMS